MKKITITVDVDGSAVSREYAFNDIYSADWGSRVQEMLDTLEKSKEEKF